MKAPSDADELPAAYPERIIAFIDVLGFGSLVTSTADGAEGERTAIARIGNAIMLARESLEELTLLQKVTFTHFSDSFVISIKADRHQSSGRIQGKYARRLEMFIVGVRTVIDCFLSFGMLLRGGITAGKFIHTKSMLFGPAMNRAYDLEVRQAKYPRIIIDPDLPHLPELLGEEWIWGSPLSSDDDGLLYVDYFRPRKVWYLVPGWLLAIQEAIGRVPATERLQEKRLWLIQKYNEHLAQFDYEAFNERLDRYVDDGDANPAVCEDYELLLSEARQLKFLV